LDGASTEPSPEQSHIEEIIRKAGLVIFGISFQEGSIEFFISDSKDNNRQRRIADIV